MSSHCSLCSSSNGDCNCTPSSSSSKNKIAAVRLFGVSLTDESFIKKSASMGNLSHYSIPTVDSPEGYHSDDPDRASNSNSRRRAHGKRGNPWTNEEHGQFLVGLRKLGKGDWRGISRNYVPSKTPTQVASHAQKYFIRQNDTRKKRRPSVFDTVPELVADSLSMQQQFNIQPPAGVTDSKKLTHLPSQESDINKLLPSLDLSLKPILMPLPFQLWPPAPSSVTNDAAGPSQDQILRTNSHITKEPGKELVGISKLTLEEKPSLLSLRLPGEP